MALSKAIERERPVQDCASPADAITSELERRDWTAGELADKMGVDKHTVDGLILCKARVERDIAERLSKALNLPPDYFLMLQGACDNPGLIGFYWGKWEPPFSSTDK